MPKVSGEIRVKNVKIGQKLGLAGEKIEPRGCACGWEMPPRPLSNSRPQDRALSPMRRAGVQLRTAPLRAACPALNPPQA